MLYSITLLTALSATGMMGPGKHCGGGKMHLLRGRATQCATPVASCGASMPYASGMMTQPAMPMAAAQSPAAMTPAPVYATPSQPAPAPTDTVPPAPVVPTAPTPPAPPAS